MKQREMPMLGQARKPTNLDDRLLDHCECLLDAIKLCIHMSRLSQEAVGDMLHIDKGQMSRILAGSAHFPTNRYGQQCGCALVEDTKAMRKAELLAELEQLERAA